MASQRRVVRFNVELEVVLQAVLVQESYDRHGVVVVLVFGRLLRLGLDEQLALKPYLLLVSYICTCKNLR